MSETKRVFGSFRDPSGFIFQTNGRIYRQVNRCYARAYEQAESSGLFEEAIKKHWLLPFKEVQQVRPLSPEAYKVIIPTLIPFVSFPYEWSFSQIKDAALLTLDLHLAGLQRGMLLKDASIYNIQFWQGQPVLIDHLSFDLADRFNVWPAYGQFCRHFLAPLALMALVDARLSQLYRVYLDGVPLDLAASLLPFKSKLNLGLLMHLHMHAKNQIKFAHQGERTHNLKKLSVQEMTAIAKSLRKTVQRLLWHPSGTEWGNYYSDTNYSDSAMASKRAIICDMLRDAAPKHVWDLGGNIGAMSRLGVEQGAQVVSFDIDPVAVEKNYLHCRKEKETLLLPLVMDFTNPSPGLGFASKERESLTDRGPADLLMALAIIHHLAISDNLPFNYLARYFANLGQWLLIEFIPKHDSQVRRLLASRKDIFKDYTQDHFEEHFSRYFKIVRQQAIHDCERVLYLMKNQLEVTR